MRKLRTQRDNQQWMLDLALNLRGRVQNFERDDLEVPADKRARNYRMLPKVWREAAERHEADSLVRLVVVRGHDPGRPPGGAKLSEQRLDGCAMRQLSRARLEVRPHRRGFARLPPALQRVPRYAEQHRHGAPESR